MIPTTDRKVLEQLSRMRHVLGLHEMACVTHSLTFEVYERGGLRVTVMHEVDNTFDPIMARVTGPIGGAPDNTAYNAAGLAQLLDARLPARA